MVRLPDIGITEWIADQQEQFKRSTSSMFDALDFELGARELESQIPLDYPLLGGPDQWQQAEQQRIKDDLDRQMREEEQRRAQQALLEEQQRQQEEAARQQAQEQQALSWAEQLGIPTPSQMGEHLQGLWNRPADNIGTTGAIPAAPPPQRDATSQAVQEFINWSGPALSGAVSGAAEAVPEGFQRANEAAQEFRESPLGMMGGMPAAMAGVSEISNAFTDPILRGASRGSGIVSQEGGSSGIDVDVPVYGRFAPTQEDIVAGVGGALLDPTNLLMEAGPLSRVIGRGEVAGARLAEEAAATAIRRAQGDDLSGILRRGADRSLEAAEDYLRRGREGTEQLPSAILDTAQAATPAAPAGWGEVGAGPGRAEQMAEGIARARGAGGALIGAGPGAVAGYESSPEDATWQDRLQRSLAGAAIGGTVGGVAAKQGTLGASRLIDSLIKRGRWNPEILSTHPAALTRVKTLLGLAAEGLPDDALVELPGQASFLALSHMPELTEVSKFLNGQGTAGEVRDLVQRTLPQRFDQAVSALVADVVTGANTRTSRAAEERADLVTMRGLPENLRGIQDPRPDYPHQRYASIFGMAQEIDQNPDPTFEFLGNQVAGVAEELGMGTPRVFVAPSGELNAAIHHPRGYKPVLVVPQGVLDADLTPQELQGLLKHEMGHTAEGYARAAQQQQPTRQPFMRAQTADDLLPDEIPNPHPLTAEERALNAAADARARAAPPHAGYLEEAEAPPPQKPPPPEARPAPPRGSAPKTIKIGPELDRASTNTPPVTANEEVMLPDGRVGKVAALMRQGRREQANDIVTVMLGDGTAIRASVSDLERHGVPTTSTSPHPGFSTGESKPLPDGRGGGAGGGGKPPAPPVGGGPTPPAPPPGRPPVGPGSVVDAQHEKLLKKNEDIAHGRIKPGPADEATLGKIEKWITIARQKLTDRRAPLEALEKYLEGITGKKLSIAQRAHLAARVYEGSSDAAKARLERGLKPTYSELSAQDLKEMDAVWEHLDAWDKSEAVRYNVQQEALGKKLSEARPRIDAVRREAEATLEVQRAKRREGAAVKEVMAAEKERTRLLADMERLGIDTEQRPPQEPGVRRAKRETQRLETPEISKAHDAWTKNTIRRQTAEARVADARERIEHEIQWAQEKIEKRRSIGAETRAENVQATRKTPSGIDPQPPETVMDNLRHKVGDERFDKIKKALDASFEMRDEMREEMVASGIWTPELAKTLMERFPHYSPTKLLEHMTELDNAAEGGKTFSISGNLIHKLTERGSEGTRVSAVESLVSMVYQYQEAAAKNKIMSRVTGWADVPAMQPFVRRLNGDEAAPQGWEAFSSRVDGKIERIAVLSPYSDALKLNSAFRDGAGGRILSGLSTPLRAGATALRPAFIVTNAVYDGISSLLRFTVASPNPLEAARAAVDLYQGYHASFGMAGYGTRAATGMVIGGGLEATREAKEAYETGEGFSPLKIVGAAAAGAGLGVAVRASKADRAAMQRMREAGGSIGERGRWGKDTIPTLVQTLRGQNRAVRVARTENDLQSILSMDRLGQLRDAAGLLWSRPLENVGRIVETAPRLAAFRRAERQGLSLEESANAARRITADFSAGGAWTKNVNTLIPFLNATTQGIVEDALSAGWGSKKQAAKFGAAMAVVVPAIIATEIWNRTVAPDDYQDVSRFTQDHGLVMLSPEAPTGEGKRGLLFIPTRGLMGSIVTLTKAALHTYLGDDPRTWQRLAADTGMAAVNHISPVSADGMGILQSMTPPMSGAAFELMANYDSFRNQPIVSRSLQTLPVSEQYDDRTSQLARQLSRTNLPLVGGSSPMKIDWALRAFSPGPGEAVLGVADAAIRQTGNELPTSITRDVPRGARDVPLVGSVSGRFLRTAGSERQNLAYDQAEEIAARNRPDMIAYLERSPDYQQATPDRQRQMLRSMETQLLELAREQSGVYEYERGKNLGLPERFDGVPPGSHLESEIVTARSTPAYERTERQWDLYLKYITQNPLYAREARAQTQQMQTIRKSYLQQEREGELTGRTR